MQAIYVIPPIVGGVFFQVQYYIYANVVYYYKRPVYVMAASIIAAILNILLNYLFIPKFGYMAAGYTTITSYIIQAFIDYNAMKKVVGCDIYNMKFILVLSIFVILISTISIYIYKMTIIRYMLLIVIIVLSILYRDKIRDSLMSIKN